MAVAVTYQSGPRRADLRTVIVENVGHSVVLLPSGSLDLLTAKLLHGTTCAHSDWAEWLSTDPESDDFACPAESVRAQREIQVAVKARHRKGN